MQPGRPELAVVAVVVAVVLEVMAVTGDPVS
jgi:hypothetical protein